jgi:hypothetical protein
MFDYTHFVIFIQSNQYTSVLSARSKTIWVSVIGCWVRTSSLQKTMRWSLPLLALDSTRVAAEVRNLFGNVQSDTEGKLRYYHEAVTWDEAKQRCIARGGECTNCVRTSF